MTSKTLTSIEGMLQDFCSKLERTRRTVDGYIASCPVAGHAHGDKNPSLKVTAGDHRVMAFCYSNLGHKWQDVYAALGYSEDQWAFDLTHETRQVLATYHYQDAEGKVLYRVRRFVPKSFDQQKLKEGADPSKETSWNKTLGDAERVPYNLPAVRDAIERGEPVWLVEGEKSAELLIREGLVATTTAMGAANWKREYTEHFGGALIYVIPDNDLPGKAYASKAAGDLFSVAKALKIVQLPGLSESQDVDDWLLRHSVDELKALALELPRFDTQADGLQTSHTSERTRFNWPPSIEIEFSRLTYENGNVHAEATVNVSGKTLVVARRINLQSSTATWGLTQTLQRRQDDISWTEYVEEAVNLSIEHFRNVGRSMRVGTAKAAPPQFLVEGVFPDMNRPTLLFGDSETAKSVLAATVLCSIATGIPMLGNAQPNRTGPVLYLDWEDDGDLFAYRVQQLARGYGFSLEESAIHYYHPPGPLHLYVDSLSREIEREGFVAVVIDSRGAAQDGPLSYEAETNRFFDAISILKTPAIVIDHIAKSDLDNQGSQHSFGSVFTRGRVVCSWRVRRGERFENKTAVEWVCAKWNHGPRLPTRRYIIDWTEGLKVEQEEWKARADEWTIYNYLAADGPAGADIIALDTGLDRETVDELLRAHPDKFVQTVNSGWEATTIDSWGDKASPF